MTIAHNHFYAGHGMSIGSGTDGGVSDVRVSDLTHRRRGQRHPHQERPQPRRAGAAT